MSYTRGLKLNSIGGPHSKEKNESRAAVYKKKFQNKLNLIQIHNFETFAGWVFETPVIEHPTVKLGVKRGNNINDKSSFCFS